MSKTHKTDPIWVRAARHRRRHIDHGLDCEYADHSYEWATNRIERPCNVGVPRPTYDDCRWLLPVEDEPRYYSYTDSPSVVDCHLMWYGPSRTEERNRLREAVKDYNANGDTDHVELDHQQHRHGISYYW